jgi:hypothetical protein
MPALTKQLIYRIWRKRIKKKIFRYSSRLSKAGIFVGTRLAACSVKFAFGEFFQTRHRRVPTLWARLWNAIGLQWRRTLVREIFIELYAAQCFPTERCILRNALSTHKLFLRNKTLF